MAKKVFVTFVLDETGSMQVCKKETIDGYNEYVKKLAQEHRNVRFTLTQFNANKLQVVHDAVKIGTVPEMTGETYRPDDLTPLYDAIATTIRRTEKKAEKDAVLFIVMTDGEENASKEHDFKSVQALIEEKGDWTFVYLGANQDAWAVGTKMGIAAGNTMSYAQSKTGQTMSAMTQASCRFVTQAVESDDYKTKSFWKDANVDGDDLK
jgi:Mg-chelatase subunit ChlD